MAFENISNCWTAPNCKAKQVFLLVRRLTSYFGRWFIFELMVHLQSKPAVFNQSQGQVSIWSYYNHLSKCRMKSRSHYFSPLPCTESDVVSTEKTWNRFWNILQQGNISLGFHNGEVSFEGSQPNLSAGYSSMYLL